MDTYPSWPAEDRWPSSSDTVETEDALKEHLADAMIEAIGDVGASRDGGPNSVRQGMEICWD